MSLNKTILNHKMQEQQINDILELKNMIKSFLEKMDSMLYILIALIKIL